MTNESINICLCRLASRFAVLWSRKKELVNPEVGGVGGGHRSRRGGLLRGCRAWRAGCRGGGVGRGGTISHDAALYLPPKWHLYLPKLSFDSLPHTEPQITFNTDIKSGSKERRRRWRRRWRAALLSADAAAARPATVAHTCKKRIIKKKKKKLCRVVRLSYCDISHRPAAGAHTAAINL